MGRKHSKRRNTLRKVVKRRNTLRKVVKRRNTKRRNTKRKNTNNRVKNKSKFINGYKIIKSLNPHKKSVKYGGSCDEVVRDDIICKKKEDGTDTLLGRGSYGSVYLVEKGGVEYAMKISNNLRSFKDEVKILNKIKDISNTTEIIDNYPKLPVTNTADADTADADTADADTADAADADAADADAKVGYIVMRYFADGNLYDNLEIITELEMVKYIKQIAEVLVELHDMEPPIYHNDVKPDNIVLHGGQAYLVDYGLATEGAPSEKGTKGYIDDVSHKADKYGILEHDTYGIYIILKEYIKYLDLRNHKMTDLRETELRKTNFNRKLLNVTDKYVEMCKNIENTAIYTGIDECMKYLDKYSGTKFELITKLLYIYCIRGEYRYLKQSDVKELNIMENWDEVLTVFEKYRSRCGLHRVSHNYAIVNMIKKFKLDSEEITAWKTATLTDTNNLIDKYVTDNASFKNWLGNVRASQKKQFETNNKSLKLLRGLTSKLSED